MWLCRFAGAPESWTNYQALAEADVSNSESVQAVRRPFDAFYAADEEAMSVLIGDDFVTHAPGGGTGDAAGWKVMAAQTEQSPIPDLRVWVHSRMPGQQHAVSVGVVMVLLVVKWSSWVPLWVS